MRHPRRGPRRGGTLGCAWAPPRLAVVRSCPVPWPGLQWATSGEVGTWKGRQEESYGRTPTRVPGSRAGGLSQVDRDALLHRYTVAPARGWLAAGLACAYGPVGGVVPKRVHGGDSGYDIRYDGGIAIGPPSQFRRHAADLPAALEPLTQ